MKVNDFQAGSYDFDRKPSGFKDKNVCLQGRIVILYCNGEHEEKVLSIIHDRWQDISFEIDRPLALKDNALLFSPLDTAGCVSISSVTVNNRATGEQLVQVNGFHLIDLMDFNEELLRVPSRDTLDLFVAGSSALVSLKFFNHVPDCPLQVTIRMKAATGLNLHRNVLKAHLELDDWETIIDTWGYQTDFEYRMLVAFAEMAMRRLDWSEAVRRWQDIVSLKGADTPYYVYERLKKAYLEQGSFIGASPQEEAVAGGIDKHDFLSFVHRCLQPEKYLEIGVQHGKSLALADCEAVGVDPMPMLDSELPEWIRVLPMTSDDYFLRFAGEDLIPAPDLVFIDGMHFFEYALRDFINAERFAAPWTLVVVDDIFPAHPAQAQRTRKTRTWAGDIWKLYEILKKYRKDLFMLPVDSAPTGILLLMALKPQNTVLLDNYHAIVKEYSSGMNPPDYILNRNDALVFQREYIQAILDVLKSARINRLSTQDILNELRESA